MDMNKEVLEKIKAENRGVETFSSLEEALVWDFDGDTIAFPAETDYSLAKEIISRGKYHFMEKPLALNLSVNDLMSISKTGFHEELYGDRNTAQRIAKILSGVIA